MVGMFINQIDHDAGQIPLGSLGIFLIHPTCPAFVQKRRMYQNRDVGKTIFQHVLSDWIFDDFWVPHFWTSPKEFV
jgi:hypothetical protein